MVSLAQLIAEAAKARGVSAAQVPQMNTYVPPVTQVASPAVITVDKKADAARKYHNRIQELADKDAMIAALQAQLSGKSATQVPAAPQFVAAAPVVVSPVVPLTRVSSYPAGIAKRTGKAYPAGAKWHAKAFPMGTTAYGGLTPDDVWNILENFQDPTELYKELTGFLSQHIAMSKGYQKFLESQGKKL